MVWVALFRAPLPCEKRKPKYTSCAPKSTLPYKTLRQTQTPTVVATPQLLSSLQCQIKGTCSTPTPKCTSELLLFSPDATVTRNRSTRTKDGTQPRNKEPKAPQAKGKGGNCFTCPRWHCSLVLFRTSDTTPLSRCLNWETRFQVSNEQPSFKGCQNNSKLLWYTNHLVSKTLETFPKVLKSNWFSFKRK